MLPVVLFHFKTWPFTGGFVGVDVFFVISGYLITGLIWGEMRDGAFSLVNFYERRVRRIFPALFAMMFVVAIASVVILFPHALKRFALSFIAAAGFASNFHFWGDSGYWAAQGSTKPLLHTWSLAVEEQFYLLFPGFLYLLKGRSNRIVLWVLGATLGASLALSIVGTYTAPITTFYLLPSRFWELALGGMLAVGKWPAPKSAVLRDMLVAAGIALIAWSVFTLSSASAFPGWNAIPPCLGAALIIFGGSGERALLSRMLGNPVPVFFGLISYSLYLWHWPIYVLLNSMVPDGLSVWQTIAAIAASVLLGFLSWRYVERPFRGRSSRVQRKPLFIAAGAAIAVSIAIGLVITAADGFPQRYDPATRKILAEVDHREPLRGSCFDIPTSKIERKGLCKFGAQDAQASFVLWGDSHADMVVPGVLKAALADHKAGFLGARGHCAPLINVDVREAKCRPFNDAVLKIALGPGIRTVLLVARWAPVSGERPIASASADANDDDDTAMALDKQAARAKFFHALADTVKTLRAAGKNVVIIGDVPEFRESVPDALAKMRVWGGYHDIAPMRADLLSRDAFENSVFETLARTYGARIVWPDRIVCPATRCAILTNGTPLYRDDNHLSVFGAELLAPLFKGSL